jgi:SAM-dependent methyltransferase
VNEGALHEFCEMLAGGPWRIEPVVVRDGRIRDGRIVGTSASYEIRDFVPRLVSPENYARSFGFQWNRHACVQLDSFNGGSISADRLHQTTGWQSADLAGERILEAGSGAGRFTEILLRTGAKVFSFDLSSAVEANYANNGARPNLRLFQADMVDLPLRPASFDKVLCLGVIQHTPDPEAAFRSLARLVKPGGQLAIDVYPLNWKALLHWKYFMRPVARRMPPALLWRWVGWYAPKLSPVARLLHRVGGAPLRRLVPILDQSDKAVPAAIQREWTVLDTFDALSARYDKPQTADTVRRWFHSCGFVDVQIDEAAISARGTAGRG